MEIPFPSSDGRGDVSHWFKSSLDLYGEPMIKPIINSLARVHDRKADWNHYQPFLPPRFVYAGRRSIRSQNEGKRSKVVYPPLMYSDGNIGGGSNQPQNFSERYGIRADALMIRHLEKYWWEYPEHPFMYVKDKKNFPDAGWYGAYLSYFAGIDWWQHQFDLDWTGSVNFDAAELWESRPQGDGSAIEEILREAGIDPSAPLLGSQGYQRDLVTTRYVDDRIRDNDFEIRPYTHVREVYRTSNAKPIYNLDGTIAYEHPMPAWVRQGKSNEIRLFEEMGSFHGRDGMLRYNMHPWAMIYRQHAITESLLEISRDFDETQRVLSAIELECKGGIFDNKIPTVVERFGVETAGNLDFALEQQTNYAAMLRPRLVSYTPRAAIPPGNAKGMAVGGPSSGAYRRFYFEGTSLSSVAGGGFAPALRFSYSSLDDIPTDEFNESNSWAYILENSESITFRPFPVFEGIWTGPTNRFDGGPYTCLLYTSPSPRD